MTHVYTHHQLVTRHVVELCLFMCVFGEVVHLLGGM